MHRVICIWLPEWPIQRLIVARPELNSAPLVLHARDPRRGQRVVACCERACQRGVLPGMPLAEVAALSKRRAVGSRFTDATSDQPSTSQQPTRNVRSRGTDRRLVRESSESEVSRRPLPEKPSRLHHQPVALESSVRDGAASAAVGQVCNLSRTG